MTDADNRTRWLALYVLCLGSLMIVLDVTIVNVALPSIREDLGFSETSLAWVVNAYLLTYGGFLLLGGRLGDLFGHRKLFLAGIALFTLASLACGLSTTQWMLVTARTVQGVGGAVASAVSLSLMMTLFTEPAERAKAMGLFGFVAAGGGSIGVLLGGVLTDLISWHWIFLVNVPIGVLVCLLSLRLLPRERASAMSGRLDVAGALTVTAALMLAVYAIVNGNQNGWTSAETLGLLGGAVVLLALFLGIESRVQSPLVPLGLFRLRNLRVSNLVGVLWAAAMFAWFFLSALYLQLVEPDHGGVLDRPLGEARHALWVQEAARDRTLARRRRSRAVRAGAGRWNVPRRRSPEHDPARSRRGHGVQSGAARGDERCRAE